MGWGGGGGGGETALGLFYACPSDNTPPDAAGRVVVEVLEYLVQLLQIFPEGSPVDLSVPWPESRIPKNIWTQQRHCYMKANK